MHTVHSTIAALFGLGLLASSVQAALNAVDSGPYLPENGDFAAWYQDTHGRALDLCLSKAISSRVAGAPGAPSYMCSLLPNPGVFDDTLPIVFPTNFPDEAFWFTGDTAIQDPGSGINLIYVSALEAAFGSGLPAAGDQISFARIRIRVDVPTAGTYVITHPYGVEVVDVDAPGTRAINMTRDIGIGAAGVYTGALGGDVGPFLRSVNGPYTETNPDTLQAETFVGDPNLLEPVTGSPFGTNYVRIEGPNGIDLRTDDFAVSGKLSSVVLPTPLIVERSTYARSTSIQIDPDTQQEVTVEAAQQDVFVEAPPPPATVSFEDTAGSPALSMSEADTTGSWYGQSTASPTPLGSVSVTAENAVAIPSSTPTTASSQLVDQVTITSATFSVDSGVLTLEARSSDETAAPTLAARVTGSGTNLGELAGATHLKSATLRLTSIPPAQVTVTSANGGSDTEQVIILP